MLLAVLGWGNAWADSWTRCTAVSDLTSGGTFIIGYETTANSGKIIPMKNTGGTATTTAAGYMASGSEIDMATVSVTTDYEFTIVASTTVTDAICIKCGNSFIGNTDTKNNCKLFAEEAETTSYGVTVGANDVFTLKIAKNSTYTTLQYNTGSPRFAVYGGAQKNLVIYKKTTGGGSTPTTYTVTVANNITGGTVTADPTTAAANATVTLTATPATGYEFGAWDVKDASNNTITVTDDKFTMPAANVTVSATFNAKATRPDNEIFYESFDTNDGTGGNDGSWNGSIATNNIKQDNEGWVYAKGNGASKCAKFGAGSSLGSATTPALGEACDATLTFKAGAWSSNSENTTLKLSVIGGGTISHATVTMKKGEWSTFTATLTSLTADSKIKFEGNAASNSRFFLDEVSVVKTGNATPVEPTTYAITVNDYIQNGTVSVSAISAKEGDVVTLTATPADGYELEEYIVTRADNNADITVTDSKFTMPAANVSVTATFKAVTGGEPTPDAGEGVTYTFASFTSANDVTLEADGYTITLHKNTGSTAPQWNGSSNEARVYAKGSVDIVSSKNIVKVVYNFVENKGGSAKVAPTIESVVGATTSGTWDAATKTWTGSDTKVTLSTSGSAGNLGFKSITVYFAEETPALKGSLNFVATNEDGYWATFSSSKDVIFDANDVIVYTVAIDNNELVTLEANNNSLSCVTDKTKDEGWVAGYYVQAGAAVLINAVEASVNYYYIDTDEYTSNQLTDVETYGEYNMLRPASAPMTGDNLFYKLAYNDYTAKSGLGFYWGAADGAAFDCKAGTAYLAVPKEATSNLRGFSFEGEGCTTGIESIVAGKTDAAIYNLQGQRVVRLQQGVNIVNGKKVIR